MKLAGRTAALLLADGGRQVLEQAGMSLGENALLPVWVEESEDLGLWIRYWQEDETRYFLLRWEYILGIDLPSNLGKTIGLKGIG